MYQKIRHAFVFFAVFEGGGWERELLVKIMGLLEQNGNFLCKSLVSLGNEVLGDEVLGDPVLGAASSWK
jgi:hypothetical protein